jgi:hypothetical protein
VFAGLLNKGIRGSIALLVTFFVLGAVAVYLLPKSLEIRHYPNLFYNYFTHYITSKAAIVSLNFLFIALGVLLVSLISVNQEMVEKQNYFPSFIYLLLCIACVNPYQVSPQVFTNVFILFSVYKLLETYRSEQVLSQIFEAAFWLCVSAFITISSIISFPLFFIILLILRPFVWREWIVALLGFFLPVFLYESMAYLSDFNQWYFFDAAGLYFQFLKIPSFSEYYLPLSVLLFILVIISILSGLVQGFGNTVKKQRAKSILLWHLFFATFGFFSGGANSSSIILTYAFPISIFIGDFLYSLRQLKVANTLLTLILLGVLLVFLGGFCVIS